MGASGEVTATRFIPRLPRTAFIVLLGDAVSWFGQGMSLPYLLFYLHQARGIDLSIAGLVMSTVALGSFIGNPVGGWLSDIFGPRAVLGAGVLCSAAGAGTFAGATSATVAFLAAGLLGLGNAIAWPAFDSLLATVVTAQQRSSAFAVRNATLNIGFALGAVTAALIVDPTRTVTLQAVYVVDAATYAFFVPLLLLIPAGRPTTTEESVGKPSYRAVLKDRLFLSVVGLSALMVTVGYSQYHTAFPGWATRDQGIPPDVLGICFAANAVTVVVCQIPVLRALTGRRRTTAVALACGGWGITWLLALIFGYTGSGWLAIGGFVATMIVFGLAETALAPTLPAIVNDLAPDHLRGRYNGVSALGWTTGFFVGPALTGFALDADAGAALLATLIAACALGALWATYLGRRLPPSANQITAD